MSGEPRSVTGVPSSDTEQGRIPRLLTRLTWLLWLVSCGVLAVRLLGGAPIAAGPIVVDGLASILWIVVTFFSGTVQSYSRRYTAGDRRIDRFFGLVFGFTLAVLVLAAADALVVFVGAWLLMGVLMAELIGHVDGWPQARAAAALARRSFLASTALVAVGSLTLWATTGATTLSGVAVAAGELSGLTLWLTAGALVLAAMVQSALVPFHTWLLASMTAPTPASALMHAGFVNAGGILLVRFAPVVTADPAVMLVIVVVGTTSALGGKLLKSVQTDVKTRLGCSTVGQMGFMIVQAGLGFFGAAVTHLVLHGFYKAYLFLSSGTAIDRVAPTEADHATGRTGAVELVVTGIAALVGGGLFAVLTGKGTRFDAGLLLTGLVVVTTMHATRDVLSRSDLPATVRYGAVPLVFLPSIALYGTVYAFVTRAMAGLPVVTAATEVTVGHALVGAAFLVAYVAVETGWYRLSDRLYVAFLNATEAPRQTQTLSREEYDEY